MLSKHRKVKITIGIILLLLVIVAGTVTYYLNFYKEDLNKNLPKTVTVDTDDHDLEGIAYKFWFDYMGRYTGNDTSSWEELADVRFNEFQLLAGDADEFAVAVTFWVQLEKGKWSTHNNWGKVHDDGTIRDIQWTLRIKRTGKNEYTLMRMEETTDTVSGLAPVEDEYQKKAGIEVPDKNIRYQINNQKLEITYDDGWHWQDVPVDVEELFKGDYSGSKKYLIDDSYIISPERTAFVIGDGSNLRILQSTDKGESWDELDVPCPFNRGVRLRLLGFTSEKNGYLILTGDRTMGFEANAILKTNDGGKTWVNKGAVDGTNRKITSGGFINDKLGFVSFGSEQRPNQPPHPLLFRTTDGGENWEQVEVPIPAKYKGIFTVAEIPTFDGSQGTLLVNQGPNGDYQGGKVLARYTTLDEGLTWVFSNLVDPDNIMSKKPKNDK